MGEDKGEVWRAGALPHRFPEKWHLNLCQAWHGGETHFICGENSLWETRGGSDAGSTGEDGRLGNANPENEWCVWGACAADVSPVKLKTSTGSVLAQDWMAQVNSSESTTDGLTFFLGMNLGSRVDVCSVLPQNNINRRRRHWSTTRLRPNRRGFVWHHCKDGCEHAAQSELKTLQSEPHAVLDQFHLRRTS